MQIKIPSWYKNMPQTAPQTNGHYPKTEETPFTLKATLLTTLQAQQTLV